MDQARGTTTFDVQEKFYIVMDLESSPMRRFWLHEAKNAALLFVAEQINVIVPKHRAWFQHISAN